MRATARLPLLLVALGAAGCGCPVRPPASAADGAAVPSPREREMAVLSLLSYSGESLTGSAAAVEAELAPCVAGQLAGQPLLGGRWQLAWGPAVARLLPGTGPVDNMMFAARAADGSGAIVVVIRGTNASTMTGWVLEDFDVGTLEPWRFASPPGLAPKIARGTERGLGRLIAMAPVATGRSLQAFLAESVTSGALDLAVTGHSLGGALAPALALWLADTREAWDPEGRVSISVFPLAGPTPGNRDFATHYDQELGPTTSRLHNRYDMVTLAWDAGTMEEGPGLYLPSIEPPPGTCDLARLAVKRFGPLGYRQVRADAPAVPGAVNAAAPGYFQQIDWQHVCGYQCGLGIAAELAPIPADCRTSMRPPCTCPGGGS